MHCVCNMPFPLLQPSSGDGEFTNISVDVETGKKKKVPRRLIHCSDGVLEEYSTDEEEEKPLPPPVDPVFVFVKIQQQTVILYCQ